MPAMAIPQRRRPRRFSGASVPRLKTQSNPKGGPQVRSILSTEVRRRHRRRPGPVMSPMMPQGSGPEAPAACAEIMWRSASGAGPGSASGVPSRHGCRRSGADRRAVHRDRGDGRRRDGDRVVRRPGGGDLLGGVRSRAAGRSAHVRVALRGAPLHSAPRRPAPHGPGHPRRRLRRHRGLGLVRRTVAVRPGGGRVRPDRRMPQPRRRLRAPGRTGRMAHHLGPRRTRRCRRQPPQRQKARESPGADEPAAQRVGQLSLASPQSMPTGRTGP